MDSYICGFSRILASCLLLASVLDGPSLAGERSAQSREKLAKAERQVGELFAAIRRTRAAKTMEEWGKAFGECSDSGMRFREMAAEMGEEAFEAFEAAVLKDIEEWERLGLEWGAYLSAVSIDRPDIGRNRLNLFIQNPKLTMHMKADIIHLVPSSSQPEEWLDQEWCLRTLRVFLDDTREFRKMASARAGDDVVKPVETRIRYSDLALTTISEWFGPRSVPKVDMMKSTFPDRDRAVVEAKKWVEARLRLLDARKAAFETLRDYRLLQLDKTQVTATIEFWKSLDKRETPANFRDMKALTSILIAEMKDREATGRKAEEIDRHFQREIIRTMQGIFKAAGHELRAPKGAENDSPGTALLWIHDAAMEASKNARTPFLRQEWGIFADNPQAQNQSQTGKDEKDSALVKDASR